MSQQKLFLIDAYALIFRFHYAFLHRPFRNSKGENVSAVFGFFKFLNELIENQNPHYLGVAFDPGGATFRHEMFPAYKANRDATPEDIKLAVPYIKQILEARAIPILQVAGFEADDVIGTLAVKASITGDYDVYMVTPDKDYGQLIRHNVSMYKPGKGGQGVEIVRLEDVCNNYCICQPEHIIDILALWGDASDNIPGVPGIGEKGACKLVGKWGTVENIIANIDALTPKQRDSILANKEQLLLSKQLATISLDAPVEFDPQSLMLQPGDDVTLRMLYKEHGFNMFLRQMDSNNYHNNLSADQQSLSAVASGNTANISNNSPSTSASSSINPKPFSSMVNLPSQGSLFGDDSNSMVENVEPTESSVQSSLFAQSLFPNEPAQSGELSKPSLNPVASNHGEDTANNIEDFANIHTTTHTYITIDTAESLAQLVDQLSSSAHLCFDTETTSINAMDCSLVGISLCVEAHKAYWIPTPQHLRSEFLSILNPLFSNESIIKIGQNIKYDMLVLSNNGIQVKGTLYDTMILHYLLNPESRHSMDFMSRMILGYNPIPIENLIGKGARQLTMDRVAPHLLAEYAAEDADITYQLYCALLSQINEQPDLLELYLTIEEPLIRTLAAMELEGVGIDRHQLALSATELNGRILELESQIKELSGVANLNINSPKQLGEALFVNLAISSGKVKKTKTGQYKTDEQTLEQYSSEHPIIPLILEYRGLRKLVSTYIEALPNLINPRTGRIHTSFNQAVTATGRLSSTNPNLQNIPIRETQGRKIRSSFVPTHSDWSIVSADYSQVELRIMAHLSGDKNLLAAFLAGEDIHTSTAAKIYGIPLSEVTTEQRRRAKTANFGIIYGISTFGLSQRLSIPRNEAKELIDGYFASYPDVKRFMDNSIVFAQEHGYIETLYHRRRYLPDITSSNSTVRGLAQRNAINAPIQGTAADIIKIAMNNLEQQILSRSLESRLILQVHDELVLEVPPHELELMKSLVKDVMMDAAHLSVPLEVEVGVGHSWLEAH